MSAPRRALRLAEFCEGNVLYQPAGAELRLQDEMLAACEPYLKDGETPAERIRRERRDTDAVLTLLAREKLKSEAMLAALKRIKATRVFLGAIARGELDDAIKLAEEV